MNNTNNDLSTELNTTETANSVDKVKKRRSAFGLSLAFGIMCIIAAALSILLTAAMLKAKASGEEQIGFAVLVVVFIVPDIILTILTEIFGAVSITACVKMIKTESAKKTYAVIMLTAAAVFMLAAAALIITLFVLGKFKLQ